MEKLSMPIFSGNQASVRICSVSGSPTELLEMHSENPSLHVVLIPGNPGIISFYKDFIVALYRLLEGRVSITAIGHISQTSKDWEHGRLFSLQEQINHKVEFIEQELLKTDKPIILVGHSIGSHMCLEIFKKFPEQVTYLIGLYPFLTLNKNSSKQLVIGLIARSSILSTAFSYIVSSLGLLPTWFQIALIRKLLGGEQLWSASAIEATCTNLFKYHTMRNVLFMAMTEFEKLSEEPDWEFMRKKQTQISMLFGVDDHWGPLSHFEEVSRQVPGLALSIEREGHTHSFCCTEAGSLWNAHHVATLIKNHIAN